MSGPNSPNLNPLDYQVWENSGASTKAATEAKNSFQVLNRVATRPDFSGTSQFSAHVSCVPARPCRDVYVPIFWSKKLIVRLNDCGIINRSSRKY